MIYSEVVVWDLTDRPSQDVVFLVRLGQNYRRDRRLIAAHRSDLIWTASRRGYFYNPRLPAVYLQPFPYRVIDPVIQPPTSVLHELEQCLRLALAGHREQLEERWVDEDSLTRECPVTRETVHWEVVPLHIVRRAIKKRKEGDLNAETFCSTRTGAGDNPAARDDLRALESSVHLSCADRR